jgi:capsular exopolysaccharide synthesis family protein
MYNPADPASESFRTLRTSVQFIAGQTKAKTFMVVSAAPGEGKTTTAANLAVVLAQAGKQTLLLSADLRNPALNDLFRSDWRAQPEVGISNILAGEVSVREALSHTDVKNLWIISSGPVHGRPAELAGSESMAELIDVLRDSADYTIIDSAPTLAVSDALAIASRVDAVIYVADASSTKRGAVVHARTILERAGANVVGAVLNRFEPSKSSAYHYAYRYTYRYEPVQAETPPVARNGDDRGEAARRVRRQT